MKKRKKLLAALMATAMVLGMSLTGFANGVDSVPQTPATPVATGKVPGETDTKKAGVANVEVKWSEAAGEEEAVNGVQVTAYRIVVPKYNEYGFIGYVGAKVTDGDEVKIDLTGGIADGTDADGQPKTAKLVADDGAVTVTSDQITAIAQMDDLDSLEHKSMEYVPGSVPGSSATDKKDGLGFYSAELGAGYWLVLVTGTVEEVYNPMVLGVYYAVKGSDSAMAGGVVDADAMWTLETTDAYAKSTKPSIEKTIIGSNGKTESGKGVNHGGDVAEEEDITFRIKTQIPSYSAEYTEVIVKITDILDASLRLKKDTIAVYVGTDQEGRPRKLTVSENGTITDGGKTAADIIFEDIKDAEGNEVENAVFQITFDSEYVREKGLAEVIVDYTAALTEGGKANVNFLPNTNEAKLTYTNNPDTDSNAKPADITDKTYTYTFAIDSTLYGTVITDSDDPGYVPGNDDTEEIIKKGVETIPDESEGEEGEGGDGSEKTAPLQGAKFSLTTAQDDAEGKLVKKTTEEKGYHYYEATSDEKGHLEFRGLAAGSYVLQEIEAPQGYTLNDREIPVEISAVYHENGTLKSYSIRIDGKVTSTYTATYTADSDKVEEIESSFTDADGKDASGSATIDIPNTKLAVLPSTGGIGTAIFTIGGCAIMIIAAGLFFVSRRKASR